jgi:FAD-NAD(P)-binding
METTSLLPDKINLAIIGGGPHALTFVTHLLQKCPKMRSRFVVFDPSGQWMSRWQQQFAAFNIPHLRSPAVHHPDPNRFALRKFAESRARELFPPYDLPGTKLSQDLCADVISRWDLDDRVVPLAVTRIEPINNSFRLWFDDGQSTIARRVVLATGNANLQIPSWVQAIDSEYPQDKLCHSSKVDLRPLQLAGEKILIVGGGLTSGHLAIGAISKGAKVNLMIRRQLQQKLFDAEPGWLGPKYLKSFFAESDLEKRFAMIQQARNGGSVTPAMGMQLRREVRNGNLTIDENCQVVKVEWLGNSWLVQCSNGNTHEFSRIWLSTGTKFDVTKEPLLESVFATYPITVVNGLPVLDKCLRWQGCELFIMGGLAALQIGPTARNLSGALMACEKIVPAIVKPTIIPLGKRSVS